MPQLEKELEEARLKWTESSKDSVVWTAEVKKVMKLEVDVVELEKSLSQLRSIHQVEIQRHAAFGEAEKAQFATELQASYNAKLPCLYVK